jgi:two-component system, sensor histidine kinase and response regulator
MNQLAGAEPADVPKILIIDDDENFRQIVVRFLDKLGFQRLTAANGKEGVALASEHVPDLILCDLAMPAMNGYEVLAALRREPKLADIPVIFLTGQSEPKQVRQGMNLGADDYLTKPVDLLDLAGAVEARLKRRQAERQRQRKQMERAMALFAGIVHDLRDPLFAVLGYTDLLKSVADGPQSSEDRSKLMLDRMQQAALRMQAIISETLFLARSRMQRLPFDPARFDLRELCEQLVADHEGNERVRFECGEGRFPILADALRLRQALENLLSNALKYSEEAVRLSLTRSAQGCRIEVSDTGIGIPAEEQASVFEPFFRASNTAARHGHGLGLSAVQSCIQQHGGSIRFVSQRNEGTTFIINLPPAPPTPVMKGETGPGRALRDSRPNPGAPQSPGTACGAGVERHRARPPTASKLTGIIVDDDPLVRGVLRDLLEGSHDLHIAGEAGTIAQARLLASQHEPAVVFLDVNLPDGSGFDLLPTSSGIRRLFLSPAPKNMPSRPLIAKQRIICSSPSAPSGCKGRCGASSSAWRKPSPRGRQRRRPSQAIRSW